jgi:hypothetical protein
MKPTPSHLLIYEINTWVWLADLSSRYGRPITLDTVPTGEWDDLAEMKFDVIWLMGVWERSPHGIRLALQNRGLMEDFYRALPDFIPEDVVGSPYCVRRYQVDAALGGRQGLAAARRALAERGMRLMLDYVPNHVAPDHPWISGHPDFFIHGSAADLAEDPASFFQAGTQVIAHGKDPNFPAWPDVAQLNVFHPGLRTALTETLLDIASQCDGLRCDMAMLMFNRIFSATWGERAGRPPEKEFWPELISSIRKQFPNFLWAAEAYWDTEAELLSQGFDYCYDKVTYDLVRAGEPGKLRSHLGKIAPYSEHLIRFIENHDEARAAAVFDVPHLLAAALLTSTLPGAVIFHEGQFEGRRTRLPVFLRRRPVEAVNHPLQTYYKQLLKALHSIQFEDGAWQLVDIEPSSTNRSDSVIAWEWKTPSGQLLVLGNLSPDPFHGKLCLNLPDRQIEIIDMLDPGRSSTHLAVPHSLTNLSLAGWESRLLRLTSID